MIFSKRVAPPPKKNCTNSSKKKSRGKSERGSPVVPRVLRGMARVFPRTTPSGLLGSCSPGKMSQTSGRLNSRGK
jgi:hypothetical protein